jgi:hypothetical protein
MFYIPLLGGASAERCFAAASSAAFAFCSASCSGDFFFLTMPGKIVAKVHPTVIRPLIIAPAAIIDPLIFYLSMSDKTFFLVQKILTH